MNGLTEDIQTLLQSGRPREVVLTEVLRAILQRFQSETGTIHRLAPEQQMLQLVAQVGLPPAMLEVVKTIPVGKGIAGETVARGGPVTICNLQTDTSGVAKPGARQTGVGGALCVPLRNGGEIVGTIGIGTLRQHEYSAEETQGLAELGRVIGAHLSE